MTIHSRLDALTVNNLVYRSPVLQGHRKIVLGTFFVFGLTIHHRTDIYLLLIVLISRVAS